MARDRKSGGGAFPTGDAQMPDFLSVTIEQLSIFQNKELADYRNVDLQALKKDQMYDKRLELTVQNLNDKLSSLKSQLTKMKVEMDSLKASNDNYAFIN
jgi:hypothetical protein